MDNNDDFKLDLDYMDFANKDTFEEEEIYYKTDDANPDLEKTALVETPVMIEVDTTAQFTTDMELPSAKIILDYAKKCGRRNRVVVVFKRSDLNDNKRTPRVVLSSKHSGSYRGNNMGKKKRSSTKKCGCPFSLKATMIDSLNGRWGLVVLNGKHNHSLLRSFEGHSFIVRLNKEEKNFVERLSKTGLKTRNMLNQLKIKDPTDKASTKRESRAFQHAMDGHVFDEVPTQSSQVSSQSVKKEGLIVATKPLPNKRSSKAPKQLSKFRVYRTRWANTTNWVSQFLGFFEQFISNMVDVPWDGHCGFKVVASFYGLPDDGWKTVRRELTSDLEMHEKAYNRVLKPLSSTSELLASVDSFDALTDPKNWMIMSYMRNVMATCYKIVVLLISKEQCLKFFLLRDEVA